MNDILQVLLDMRDGAVATDINEKFDEVVKAVKDTGGKGELTVKLRVAPSKFGLGGIVLEVEAEHECKVKKPELAIGKSLFFLADDGTLSRNNPNQVAMFAQQETK